MKWTSLFLALSMGCTGIAISWAAADNTDSSARLFHLSKSCPGSFELTSEGKCALRTLYQQYSSIDGHGGLRASLPEVRENFTPDQIDLGRILFFDPILSADRKNSCAHCHNPYFGFSDGKQRALGLGSQGDGSERHGGILLGRRTPTLWNVGFMRSFFWDGRAHSLEEQAEGPLTSKVEMGSTRESIETALNNIPEYQLLFFDAYGSKNIRYEQVTNALAAFESTLVSLNSRYDRYANGDVASLTGEEIKGMNTFRGFVARCSQCHTPPLFTNGELAVLGAPKPVGIDIDIGAGAISGDPMERGAFKVPTLRNITRTGPYYFQSGQFQGLDAVLQFYNAKRGHSLPRDERQNIHWHIHMMRPELTAQDLRELKAFLATLEDESMLPEVPTALPSGLVPIKSQSINNQLVSNKTTKENK